MAAFIGRFVAGGVPRPGDVQCAERLTESDGRRRMPTLGCDLSGPPHPPARRFYIPGRAAELARVLLSKPDHGGDMMRKAIIVLMLGAATVARAEERRLAVL